MVKEIINLLKEKKLTLSTMESCTSGLLCSTLTDVEGSSQVVCGGYITYSNRQKIIVGVNEDIINSSGVYSKECSIEMAKKAKSNTNSNIGIGVTGSLGNIDINNKDSIVGIIYYTIIIENQIYSNKITLSDIVLQKERKKQKTFVVQEILNCLELLLKKGRN